MVRFSRVGVAVCLMGHPLWRWPLARMSHREGNILKDQAYGEKMGVSPRNPGECGFAVFAGSVGFYNSDQTGSAQMCSGVWCCSCERAALCGLQHTVSTEKIIPF